MTRNVDSKVAQGFGDEWSTFPQSEERLTPGEHKTLFDSYFGIFPWDRLPVDSIGLDAGCGSGRWSALETFICSRCHYRGAQSGASQFDEFQHAIFRLAVSTRKRTRPAKAALTE